MDSDQIEDDTRRIQRPDAGPVMQHDAIPQRALLRKCNIGRTFFSNPMTSDVTLRP